MLSLDFNDVTQYETFYHNTAFPADTYTLFVQIYSYSSCAVPGYSLVVYSPTSTHLTDITNSSTDMNYLKLKFSASIQEAITGVRIVTNSALATYLKGATQVYFRARYKYFGMGSNMAFYYIEPISLTRSFNVSITFTPLMQSTIYSTPNSNCSSTTNTTTGITVHKCYCYLTPTTTCSYMYNASSTWINPAVADVSGGTSDGGETHVCG